MKKKRSNNHDGNPHTEGFDMFGAKTRFLLVLSIALFGLSAAYAALPGDPARTPFNRGVADGWSGGRWNHGFHEGRFGWWWTVGPSWYWYAQPAYPYPAYPYGPQETGVQDYAPLQGADAPPDEVWYYCNDPKGYYPYVEDCRQGWRKAPIVPSLGSASITPGAHQYYCSNPEGFYPEVDDCKSGWRIVPSIAPPR